jgi:hypothetical protein
MKTLSVALLLALLPLQVKAQSLAEVAEKEKQRRAAAKTGKKVYTEDDLKRAGGKTASFPEGPASSEATPASTETKPSSGTDAAPPKTGAENRADKRAELQKRLDEELKVKATVQKAVDDAQRELGDVSVGYPRRGSLLKVVEDGQKEMAKVAQNVAAIEDEARRAGVSLPR